MNSFFLIGFSTFFALNFFLMSEKKEEQQIFIKELRKLVFLEAEEKELPTLHKNSGIIIYNLYIPSFKLFCKKMEKFLLHHASSDTLKEIQSQVSKHFQENHLPISAVLVPADQDVSEGVVKFVVVIGKVGKIEARGARYFSNENIAKQIRLKKGEIIRDDKIFADMDWINQNPFRYTDLVYKPGKNPGETDLLLCTKDRFPARLFAGYENTGNLIAGNSRIYAGFNLGNLWKLEHRLNYLVVTAPDGKNWLAQTASYILPIHSIRNVLEFYGGYVRSKPPKEEGDLKLNGKEWEIAGRYNVPLHFGMWRHNFFLGYEFKRTNNFLNFAETLIFDNFFDISQFLLGYDLFRKYSSACTQLGIIFYLSPGNMTAFNRNRFFEEERSGAKSRYLYAKMRFEQSVKLPLSSSWVLLMQGQISTTKLLPSETFTIGGAYTVRGYDENELFGDNGILIKNEFRTKIFTWNRKKTSRKFQEIQFLAFCDFGIVSDVDKHILNKNWAYLLSVGPGVRYNATDHLSIRFDYGFQLKDIHRLVDETKKHSRAHFAATLSF
ncbi:MAG: BamA/TamA family outer membrane protein [Chlamydiae bacterium]|nr:BamA/TamA family outer membrane protein [Chlamydiota bacterium]